MPEEREPVRPSEDQPFWEELGIRPAFDDEADAPIVDMDLLRKYYGGELDEAGNEEVRRLVSTSRTWFTALGEVAWFWGKNPDEAPLPPPEKGAFWKAFGITPTFQDEAKAPPVDEELLRRYHRDELDKAAWERVTRLAGRYRSWYMALAEAARHRGEGEN